MAVVAVVALACYGFDLWRRAGTYRKRADSHAVQVSFVAHDASPEEAAQVERFSRRVNEYHALMHRKYDRAARFPWLPVETDPPEPAYGD